MPVLGSRPLDRRGTNSDPPSSLSLGGRKRDDLRYRAPLLRLRQANGLLDVLRAWRLLAIWMDRDPGKAAACPNL
jgi:hypothetical protein